ncbi:septal ring lytic transglycosylase RlpA family protein [Rufibacter immobilis]|uniref:Probable endolytic peptidoglycan transglycosylase RlpA n=1 Tax=Rufibacter immobilis TaxID=1348778 RepID=A0A3M9N617_9BACT|nr:septal ring lytic transglycosylase RlpA family protein [Rufibacter immobilis]RNI32438.1 septal ring lytic transglycosylase RlpA family protein [Rufibacter immobilis]
MRKLLFPLRHLLLSLVILIPLLSGCGASAPAFGEKGYTESGKASYYSDKLRGNKMANGQRYRPSKRTAAHKKLPFGTKVKVTNPRNGRSVKVRITDRGPYAGGRIIDLSKSAARKLDMVKSGVVPVQMKVVKEASK